MATPEQNPVTRAETFLWHAARLLERRRFEQLFRQGAASHVVDALRGYQNSDGGFGQALEPDFRGPVSQPLAVDFALRVLDECGHFEPTLLEPALAFLMAIRARDGGVPNVLANALAYPRAPWWQPDPLQPGCLLPTASIAGLLHKHRVEHPLLCTASDFCWRALARIPERIALRRTRLDGLQIAYELRAALPFLDHTPERARAEQSAAAVGKALLDAAMIELDPEREAESASPLEFASAPDTLAHRWFDERVIDRALTALTAQQGDDGGFPISWQVWTPLAGLEWRAVQTLERLKTLRSYGRLAATEA